MNKCNFKLIISLVFFNSILFGQGAINWNDSNDEIIVDFLKRYEMLDSTFLDTTFIDFTTFLNIIEKDTSKTDFIKKVNSNRLFYETQFYDDFNRDNKQTLKLICKNYKCKNMKLAYIETKEIKDYLTISIFDLDDKSSCSMEIIRFNGHFFIGKIRVFSK